MVLLLDDRSLLSVGGMFKLVVEKAVILLLLAVVVAVAVAVDEKGRRNNIVEDVAMNLRSDDVQLFIVVAVE